MNEKKAFIIGLGLIGGSLAKALKSRLNFNISAFDVNGIAIENALNDQTIDSYININDKASLKNTLSDIDIIFLCTPANITCDILRVMEPFISKNTIVTDTCSTKNNIVQYIKTYTPNLNFIGGHPMAGSEKSGYSASNDHLFENAYYVLTPIQAEEKSHNILGDDNVSCMKEIIEGLGAIPIIISPEKHDFAAAAVSHVPHILAFSLVNMVKELDEQLDPENLYMHTLAAGGFKDLTRIASSDAVMWENICKTNSENIAEIVEDFCDNLIGITKKIRNGESVEMIKFFNKAKKYRDSFSQTNIGIVKPSYKLKIDISDRVGAIAKITTLLAKNKINIKNLNIENNRELEGGCLVIYFENKEENQKATALLRDCGILD